MDNIGKGKNNSTKKDSKITHLSKN